MELKRGTSDLLQLRLHSLIDTTAPQTEAPGSGWGLYERGWGLYACLNGVALFSGQQDIIFFDFEDIANSVVSVPEVTYCPYSLLEPSDINISVHT